MCWKQNPDVSPNKSQCSDLNKALYAAQLTLWSTLRKGHFYTLQVKWEPFSWLVPLPKQFVMAFTWEESVGSSLLDILLGKTYKIFDSLWLSPQGLLRHWCSMEIDDFIFPFLLSVFDSVFLYLNMFYFSFLNNLISISSLHLFHSPWFFRPLFSLTSNSLIYSSIHFLFHFFYRIGPPSQCISSFTVNNITYILLFFSFLCLPANPWHWTLSVLLICLCHFPHQNFYEGLMK